MDISYIRGLVDFILSIIVIWWTCHVWYLFYIALTTDELI